MTDHEAMRNTLVRAYLLARDLRFEREHPECHAPSELTREMVDGMDSMMDAVDEA